MNIHTIQRSRSHEHVELGRWGSPTQSINTAAARQPIGRQSQIQRWRDPPLLRCERGANTAQNGTGFKNVSREPAYRQRWELFPKREEAVITSPSVAPCATEIIFVLEVRFDMLSLFLHSPPPHSGKQTWCSVTSAFAVRGSKWGGR